MPYTEHLCGQVHRLPRANSAGICRCLCGMCTATWCLECLIGSSTALRMPNRLWEHQWSISNGGIVLLLVSLQTEKVSFAAIYSWIQSVMQPTCEDGTTASGNSQATRSRRASEGAETRKWRLARGSVLSEATSCVGKSGGEGEALYGTI